MPRAMSRRLTGGGIRLAFRYGRRAGQLIADHLTRNGPPPEQVLAREVPGIHAETRAAPRDGFGPPNWLYDPIIGTGADALVRAPQSISTAAQAINRQGRRRRPR